MLIMLKASIEAAIFSNYGVGTYTQLRVSHLQFVDNTFLFYVKRVGEVLEH